MGKYRNTTDLKIEIHVEKYAVQMFSLSVTERKDAMLCCIEATSEDQGWNDAELEEHSTAIRILGERKF